MLIPWDTLFETGVAEIDKQHKRLVDIINNVYDDFSTNGQVDNLVEVLNELIDYTKFHFSTEEQYFYEFDYAEKEPHIAQHNVFTDKVDEFVQQVEAGKATVSYDVINFLKDWLINHILDSDKKYVPLFKRNGL